jgi:hypothetical protein
VVKKFAPQINDFINTLMRNNNVENKEMTKVVPIVSLSIGINASGNATVGAVQVQGPKAALDKVQAVAQIEATFSNQVRIKTLIPVDTLNPLKGKLHRIYGVGVTALVDVKI